MPTGIQSFSNPGEIGPIYPGIGLEVPMAIIGIILWVAWHVWQSRGESAEFDRAEELFDAIGPERIFYHQGAGRIATVEELRVPKPPTPLVAPPELADAPAAVPATTPAGP